MIITKISLAIVISMAYIVSLIVIFLTKSNANNEETKIYKILLSTNLVGLFLHLFAETICYYYDTIPYILSFVVLKGILIYYYLYGIILLSYLVVVSQIRVKELALKIINFFTVAVSVALLFMPIHVHRNLDNMIFYTYGIDTDVTYIVSAVIVFIMICVIILQYKELSKRKVIPLVIFIIGGVISIAIQKQYPHVIIIDLIESVICCLMYFTIENPDIKMIQQLEIAKDQADKANRAKTDFLSSMSHEIRTPLNAIVGFSDCIMDAENLGEAKENAKDIVNASQTLLEIVNGILDISKIEAGKLEIINTKYNAPETFEELAKLITPKMHEKGLDFTYSIAPDLPKTLFGDHANIKKIVTNLLSNACKYTERGFVHYEVNCVNSKGVTKLIISVEDSGRGIKKDSIDKMFTKFQRLDEDRNTTIEGTGLGLAITKQLIELMGGRIIVHTVYGEGSKFTVVLNQKIETEDVEEKKKVSSTLDLHDVRILMVDDTALNIKVGCKLLEKYNANHIITCDNGFECVERIQRGEIYDLILLDDMMPKMSGVETLKKLKEIPGFKVPTIALTANAITGMREKYLADGFDDYLAKPIEKEQLIQVVNQVLGRSITEEIKVPEERVIPDQVIRGEEVPNMDDVERAEVARENPVIPVEENIEEVLGDTVERNYQKDIEQLETVENPIPTDLIPVVDINVPNNNSNEEKVDRSYLESHGVDVNHALELLGDMDMYNMTISDFMREVEEKWNKIVDYKNTNNMPDYAIEVHSLKSDCKYLGFMSLAEIAYQHELKSKENDSAFVNEHFGELEEEYKKVLEIAKEYVQHNPVEG